MQQPNMSLNNKYSLQGGESRVNGVQEDPIEQEEADLVNAFTVVSLDTKEKNMIRQKYLEYENLNKIYEKEIEKEFEEIKQVRETLGTLKFNKEKEFEIRGKIKMEIEHVDLLLNAVDNDDTGKVELEAEKEKTLIEYRYISLISFLSDYLCLFIYNLETLNIFIDK